MADTSMLEQHARRTAEFFSGTAGLPVIRHHRDRDGSAMWNPAGGMFLARACDVEWDAVPAQGVEVPHYAHLVLTAGQVPGSGSRADGGGAWLDGPDPYTAWGHMQTAMMEDDDRTPYRAVVASGWPLGVVLVGLALLVAACFMTDGGGY